MTDNPISESTQNTSTELKPTFRDHYARWLRDISEIMTGLFLLLWMLGAPIGVVIGLIYNNAIDVLLSLMLPGYGVYVIIKAIFF